MSRRRLLSGAIGVGLTGGTAGAVLSAGLVWSGPAAADGGPPVIHPRRAWGARRPKEHARVLRGGPDHIVVHHTATPNSGDASLAHAFALSRAIQRFHMGGRGWSDIGEQLTISRGGHIMEGRNRSLRAMLSGRHAVGAQTLNHNSHTIGIENEGNYMRAPVPPALWSSLVRVCGWLCTVYGLDPYRAIVGHRDFNATSCPGDVLYARLPELRRQAAGLIGRPGPVVPAPKSSTGTGGDVEDDEQFDFGDYDDSGPV
ncbi:N-acetylmuramoyl-L-alanine amidase [Actinomadura alba]|uniref:N-acetylmuramoyl-L-alanine amidase n=1 Tax=Actinomadura alba TaxID=406431 RepID=A0ABR7LMV5_9ACTN|nr:N-acetylmuramoyl-L-alanine amidase [Actinomadura alba]